MIKSVTIKNFKAFKHAAINLAPLTLFTGMNGMGKSTFIQSLLLLRQSNLNNGLSLSGDLLELGKGKDVFSINPEGDHISFELNWISGSSLTATFDFSKNGPIDSRKSVSELDVLPIKEIRPTEHVFREALFTNNFQYLAADRYSPKAFFPASVYKVEELRSIGIHGEFAAHYLAAFQRDDVMVKETLHEGESSPVLLNQVSAWLSEITPGVDLISTLYADLDIAKLSYRFEMSEEFTEEFRPVNVGFGFSYALPIVTAILSSEPGDLIIVENPESHLHPQGQVAIGKLIAKAARGGVQIITESHSDHLLNSFCVSTKNGIIKPDDIAIYYFEREAKAKEHVTEIKRPQMQPNGRLDSYPKGFFDEFDKQMDELLN